MGTSFQAILNDSEVSVKPVAIQKNTGYSNIKNNVKGPVDSILTETRDNIGGKIASTNEGSKAVDGQYMELQNHHRSEKQTQDEVYNKEKNLRG
ncbi:hypothetical protein ACLEC2_00445 [Lonsdalea quercina]|uniref:hypothetical protein n=1 Tax=Lonsdalea quercina TaxID=71657 RepID=UPI0039767C35